MTEQREQLLAQIMELIQAGRTDDLKALLAEQRTSDLAEIVEILQEEQQRIVFDLLDRTASAEVLEKVDEATRSELFELLAEDELTGLIEELDADDAADLLAELPEEESKEVLEQISDDLASQIKDLMVYSEDSAGGIMDPSVISVCEDATVGEAIHKFRQGNLEEDFFAVFVTDKDDRFMGEVRIRFLITKPEQTRIKDIMEPDTLFVTVDTDQEEIFNLFKKNNLIVVPVVDHKHRLVGRITADRVIEVGEEEAAEDFYAMAGTDPAELETFSILRAARIRMTWLLPCLAGTAVTTVVALFFKNVFFDAKLVTIYATAVAFVTMVAAISGNAGLQTSAIVVCGLATGDLAALKLGQVFAREVRVALTVALFCGLAGALLCGLVLHLMPAGLLDSQKVHLNTVQALDIAGALGLAMFSAIMVATTLGLLLPFLFRRIGIDPAISSGPLVTTANDSISVAIYLSLTLFLIG
ncbi:MAG: magnesium transporter [Sedimentisphaerales bacterium]|nr:magnesium transporter [Sedimentisphaerales bacterium]